MCKIKQLMGSGLDQQSWTPMEIKDQKFPRHRDPDHQTFVIKDLGQTPVRDGDPP